MALVQAAGDFNGDGHLDIFVANGGQQEGVDELHFGDGALGFTAATSGPFVDIYLWATNAEAGGSSLRPGADPSDPSSWRQVIGEGGGGCGSLGCPSVAAVRQRASVSFKFHFLILPLFCLQAAADFNEDGIDDLYIVSNYKNRLLMSDTSGNSDDSDHAGFTTRYEPDDAQQNSVAVVSTHENGGCQYTHKSQPCLSELWWQNSVAVVAANLDGDDGDHVDIFYVNFGEPNVLMLGAGDGTFTAVAFASNGAGDYYIEVTVGDFNGDSYLDIFVLTSVDVDNVNPDFPESSTNSLHLGTAAGSFDRVDAGPAERPHHVNWHGANWPQYGPGGRRSVAAGDLNGDGFDDLLVCGAASESGGESRGGNGLYYGGAGSDGSLFSAATSGGIVQEQNGGNICIIGDLDGDEVWHHWPLPPFEHQHLYVLSLEWSLELHVFVPSFVQDLDIYVFKTPRPQLYLNDGGGVFHELNHGPAVASGSFWLDYAMTVDLNRDGISDLYICKHEAANRLLMGDHCDDGYARTQNGDSGCMGCPATTTDTGRSNWQCEYCPAGRMGPGPAIGRSQRMFCIPCDPGTARIVNGSDCAACDAGKYAVGGAPECLLCDAGRVTSTVGAGATGCMACSAGEEPNVNQTACNVCPTGVNTFSKYGIECVNCPSGAAVIGDRTGCEDIGSATLDSAALAADILDGSNVLPKATLTLLDVDETALLAGSPARSALLQSLVEEVAAALGIDAVEIEITRLAASSSGRRRAQTTAMEVDVSILSANPGDTLLELEQQLQDENSPLLSMPTSTIDANVGMAITFACPIGLHRPAGAADCLPCSGTAIPDTEDNTRCVECPARMAPDPATSTTCVCDAGFYDATLSNVECYDLGGRFRADVVREVDACVSCEQLDCVECKLGHTYVKQGYSVSSTQIKTGVEFMAIAEQQRAVYPCMDTQACSGELTAPCRPGTQGPLCSVCEEGWSHPGLQGKCAECDGTMSTIWIVFGSVVSIVFVTCFLYFASGVSSTAGKMTVIITLAKIGISLVQVSNSHTHPDLCIAFVPTARRSTKTQTSFALLQYQILTQMGSALQLKWPGSFTWLLDLLKVFSFDFLGFLDVGCMTTYTYFDKFVFAISMGAFQADISRYFPFTHRYYVMLPAVSFSSDSRPDVDGRLLRSPQHREQCCSPRATQESLHQDGALWNLPVLHLRLADNVAGLRA